jgi:hypothetical protein
MLSGSPDGSSPPSVAMDPRVMACSPMSGGSLPGRWRRLRAEAKCSSSSLGQCGFRSGWWLQGFGVRASAVESPPTGRGPCQAIRCARLERERMAPASHAALTAAFHSVAPARCGAFVDEGRVVAGEGGGRAWTRYAHSVRRHCCVAIPQDSPGTARTQPRVRNTLGIDSSLSLDVLR